MERICKNCLNAYNSPYTADVLCWNKEWEQQFKPDMKTSVSAHESCEAFTQRNPKQKPLYFARPTQLYLDFG